MTRRQVGNWEYCRAEETIQNPRIFARAFSGNRNEAIWKGDALVWQYSSEFLQWRCRIVARLIGRMVQVVRHNGSLDVMHSDRGLFTPALQEAEVANSYSIEAIACGAVLFE